MEKYIRRLFLVIETHPLKQRIEAAVKKVDDKIENKRLTETLVFLPVL